MKKNDKFFNYFRDIHIKFVRLYGRILRQAGLTLPKYALLSQLTAYGNLSMTEASEKLYISKPALTKLVRRLEQAKFVRRLRHPNDHRSYLLSALPKGKQVVAHAQSFIFTFISGMLSDLPHAEAEMMEKFNLKLSKHLDVILSRNKKP
ncbi:MAG: MarR family transcriptional regulator [Candidatus Omnitrophica bacterium]|nr:MarR family transcriptional regulator [Candidatus Omnitrophota bacterium]MDD5672163.1 MarR family transcriptional regulator [Candidatus Omnitrophota bacterium]